MDTHSFPIGRLVPIAAAVIAMFGVATQGDADRAVAAPAINPKLVAVPEPPVQPAVDPPGIYGADTELTAMIQATIARFNDSGLALPPLRIYAHAGTDARGG